MLAFVDKGLLAPSNVGPHGRKAGEHPRGLVKICLLGGEWDASPCGQGDFEQTSSW